MRDHKHWRAIGLAVIAYVLGIMTALGFYRPAEGIDVQYSPAPHRVIEVRNEVGEDLDRDGASAESTMLAETPVADSEPTARSSTVYLPALSMDGAPTPKEMNVGIESLCDMRSSGVGAAAPLGNGSNVPTGFMPPAHEGAGFPQRGEGITSPGWGSRGNATGIRACDDSHSGRAPSLSGGASVGYGANPWASTESWRIDPSQKWAPRRQSPGESGIMGGVSQVGPAGGGTEMSPLSQGLPDGAGTVVVGPRIVIPGLSSDGVAPAAEIDTPIIIDIAQLTEAQMRTVLKVTGWPAELIEAALKVSWCESRWSPGAIGGTSWGLFQIQPSPWASYAGVYAQDLFDPIINAKVALAIVRYDEDRGMAPFKQWTCRP